MRSPLVLVPVRYPLKAPSLQTVRRATDFATQFDGAHLYVLHVNLLHKSENVGRRDFQRAVERAVGPLPDASYHVRDAFLLEEAILYEACQQDADFVVIGASTRARWRRLLARRLGIDVDPVAFLRQHLDAELVVSEYSDERTPPPGWTERGVIARRAA